MAIQGYSSFNQNEAFTNAYIELYKSSSTVFANICHKLSKSLAIISRKTNTNEKYTETMQNMRILEVLIVAENEYLKTFQGTIKCFFEKIGGIFGAKTDLELAQELHGYYLSLKQSMLSNDMTRLTQRAEDQAEKIMAQFIATISNTTFIYEVGNKDKKKVYAEPNGELYARYKKDDSEYLILLLANGDICKTNIRKKLGSGTEHIVFPGTLGSCDYKRHNTKVAVSISRQYPTLSIIDRIIDPKKIARYDRRFDRDIGVGEIIESCEKASGIIKQYGKPFILHIGGYSGSTKGTFESNKNKAIFHVLEYCPNSLRSFLEKLKAGIPKAETKEIKKSIITSIIKGVSQLHSKKIIHRDLKPDNILLVGDPLKGCYDTKIIDFGLAARATDEKKEVELRKRKGTDAWTAPEMWCSQPDGFIAAQANDIWALGLICFEIWFDEFPLEDLKVVGLLGRLKQKEVNQFFDGKPAPQDSDDQQFVDTIKAMLQVDPSKRKTAQELLDMLKKEESNNQEESSEAGVNGTPGRFYYSSREIVVDGDEPISLFEKKDFVMNSFADFNAASQDIVEKLGQEATLKDAEKGAKSNSSE